ncbi:MAG: hypothetical protein WBB29_00075 [Geitlerinemataceae cyanobacterium]
MQYPKDKNLTLIDGILENSFLVKYSPETGGIWLPREAYRDWVADRPRYELDLLQVVQLLNKIDFQPAPQDSQAGICPETGRLMVRARVNTPRPFYVERSGPDGGIWLDYGEWEVLSILGLHLQIDSLFSSEWQAAFREVQQLERQRQATIEKLGEDLAAQVFQVGEALRAHPNGDFGVAYLMQQFDRGDY